MKLLDFSKHHPDATKYQNAESVISMFHDRVAEGDVHSVICIGVTKDTVLMAWSKPDLPNAEYTMIGAMDSVKQAFYDDMFRE